MPRRTNREAARLIRRQRVNRGLSPEELSRAIERGYGTVSGRQIRRIEADGIIPTPRVQLVIARFFGQQPTDIWPVE